MATCLLKTLKSIEIGRTGDSVAHSVANWFEILMLYVIDLVTVCYFYPGTSNRACANNIKGQTGQTVAGIHSDLLKYRASSFCFVICFFLMVII